MARPKKAKKEVTVTAVRGVAPKKGQLPAGLLAYLKSKGRLGEHVHVLRPTAKGRSQAA